MPRDKVTLNVGGESHVTTVATLQRLPRSRLASLTVQDPCYDPELQEYFFDRNPRLFAYILDYYRTGRLHFPREVCGPTIKDELEYWRIPDSAIADCCWHSYEQHVHEQRTLQQLRQVFRGCSGKHVPLPDSWQGRLWVFLEDPHSSIWAKVWAYLFMALIFASIGVVCAETHPLFRVAPSSPLPFRHSLSNSTKMQLFLTTSAHPALVATEYTCTAIFSLELLIKFAVWPGKLGFFTKFFNVIDLLSVVPMFVNACLRIVNPHFWRQHDLFLGYCVISVSNVFRAVRILKLVKHHRGLQIMYLAIRASASEILLLLLLILICTVIFSTMIFFAEFTQDDTFPHIPIGFWWAIVTMTTVGYGDKVPTSTLGYVVGSVCAMTGMLATGLPIPVIANNFYLYHSYAQRCERMGREEEKQEEAERKREEEDWRESAQDTDPEERTGVNGRRKRPGNGVWMRGRERESEGERRQTEERMEENGMKTGNGVWMRGGQEQESSGLMESRL